MLSYGITDIQTKPSLIKKMDMGKIIDKRANTTVTRLTILIPTASTSNLHHQLHPILHFDNEDNNTHFFSI